VHGARVGSTPGLLGSLLWCRPGLCQWPISDSYIGPFRAIIAIFFPASAEA
jgi:hypothetical protein